MDRLLSMRVFQRVIDEGGFAAAARALALSPAAVTRLVGDLEAHLGARLMQRSTRSIRLTEAGRAYLESLRAILQGIDEAEAVAAAGTRELQGTLRIVSAPALAAHVLAPRIAPWRALHPRLALDIATDPLPQQLVAAFDLGLLLLEDGCDLNLAVRPLARTETILCASPAYLRRAGVPGRPEALADHACLRFPGARRLRLQPRQGAASAVEVEMPVALQSASFELLCQAALEGAGIAALASALVAPQLARGELVRLLPAWVAGRFTICAALPRRTLMPARTRAFLDFLDSPLPGAAS
ncbi:LysR substrate-binding domain-containing protein [Variovorax guangxiensis]|uniref:LysR family transcriptional regulator n=1 Tax=Variovorax guangxiensis TaxID=1775474 RepID=UPI00285EBAB3|nr:LysR substrate-binding domain-containing protein [Variovorax guangxiensis]MDR6858324.1 DNA-binding transcriptional LysR family regulator [Variovorax guangxiensis]